jgi:outer membrane protein TolC
MKLSVRALLKRAAGASVVLLGVVSSAGAQQITLQRAVETAQQQGLQSRAAASARDAALARDRAFGARLLPQFSLSGTIPRYNRSIIPVTQPDGSTLFRPQQETNSDLRMDVSQRLPFSGGTLTLSSRLAQLRRSGSQSFETWNSSPFTVSLSQNILRPNTLGWDNREQGLRTDVAERQYLEAREDIAVQTSTLFFDLYAARVALNTATANAATNDTLYNINQGRFEVGKIGENDLLQSELALLRARTALDGARLDHDRAAAALRRVLNLPAGAPLDIEVTTDVPTFDADTNVAVAQALRNRSQMTDLELQDVQAQRRVSEARFATGPGATLFASYGYNATGPERNLAYRDLQEAQTVSLGLTMPLFTWGARSADIQAAHADRQRVVSSSRATRDEVAQEAHFAALQVAQSRRQLSIAAKADTVAAKRFEVAYNRYVIGRIGIDNLYVAQNEKDQARQQFVQSLRGFWNAYYRLRRLTLYDFESGRAIR